VHKFHWHKPKEKGADKTGQAPVNETAAVENTQGLYEGQVQLTVTTFIDFHQINTYAKYLARVKNLTIVSQVWSEDEGFNILVALQEPMDLEHILPELPEVETVYAAGFTHGSNGIRKICVVLITTDENASPASTQ
jgi:hypothetical protein